MRQPHHAVHERAILRGHVLVAEAHVQRETVAQLPVVLDIPLDLREAIPSFAVGVGFGVGGEIADQGVAERITGGIGGRNRR